MKPLLLSFLLMLGSCAATPAQPEAQDAKSRKLLEEAANNGNPLRTEISVNGNVHAQAVLIPRVDARRIFGSEIANNYAVIEVNVGNKTPDAALIIHGIFIDYRKWPLSGSTPAELNAAASRDSYQASSVPSQVASAEYRIVRGQLLDAQTDTLRNRLLRWLTLAGNLAGAFTFSLNEQGIVKGIAAATGVGIPGFATAWPDKTIEQLNRVSDFGFQANKVVPRQGSEVIVCFFPIDRFLSPGFKKIFLKSPALFFAPLQMLFDKSIRSDVDAAIGELLKGLGVSEDKLRENLPCFMIVTHEQTNPGYASCLDDFGLEKDPTKKEDALRVKVKVVGGKTVPDPLEFTKFKTFLILQFIGNVSLNRVTVTVDGVMSVDINTIPPRIDEVDIDKLADCGDAGNECFWTDVAANGGMRKGVIRGSYLTNAEVAITDASQVHIEDVKTIKEESTDRELHFSFKLTAPVPNQTKLNFTVTKTQPASATTKPQPLQSNAFDYVVTYSPASSAIDSAVLAGNTLTINGRGFDPATLTVTLHPDAGKDVTVPAASLTPAPTRAQFVIANVTAIPGVKSGCWSVQAQSADLTSNRSEKFAIAPNPTITSATRNNNFIFVKGTDLIDLSRCGGQQVSFKLKDSTGKVIDTTVVNWDNGKPVLTLPDEIKTSTNTWKVQVLLNGNTVAANGEVELKPLSQ